MLLSGCPKPVRGPRPASPPAPVLVVELERLSLRTAAWTELHAWLAAAARSPDDLSEPDLDPVLATAIRGYTKALEGDDDDAALIASFRALSACAQERCALDAMRSTPFGPAFADAYPTFVRDRWAGHAAASRSGVDAVREAVGPATETLFQRLAHDLAIELAEDKLGLDLVAVAPSPGKRAPIRPVLASRGACFGVQKGEPARVHDARILDCAFVYAALALAPKSALYDALVKELGERAGARAFTLVIVHASASVVTAWESKHVSVLRRSALASDGPAMEWLAEGWSRQRDERDGASAESAADFARRFAEVVKKPR